MQKYVYTRHIKNEENHWWFVARREIIYSVIRSLKKNKLSILDFGAGSGTNIKILTKLGSVDVYEVNPKMRSFLKTKFKKKSNVRIISKITKKYNLILAADVIEHIKNDKHVINNFYKFLKKTDIY